MLIGIIKFSRVVIKSGDNIIVLKCVINKPLTTFLCFQGSSLVAQG